MTEDESRDYYRDYIKELYEYHRPFLVAGTYQPPVFVNQAYFCVFSQIKPYVFGAVPKLICSHIHIRRELCEKYFKRFTNDLVGKRFVLCVEAYLYDDDRGGLELTDKMEKWIDPIFPISWYKSPRAVYQRLPQYSFLDFRWLKERSHFISKIFDPTCLRPAPRKKKHDAPKEPPVARPRPTASDIQRDLGNIRKLWKTKTGKKIAREQGLDFDKGTPGKVPWFLGRIGSWTWARYEIVQLMQESIHAGYDDFQKAMGKSLDEWYATSKCRIWL